MKKYLFLLFLPLYLFLFGQNAASNAQPLQDVTEVLCNSDSTMSAEISPDITSLPELDPNIPQPQPEVLRRIKIHATIEKCFGIIYSVCLVAALCLFILALRKNNRNLKWVIVNYSGVIIIILTLVQLVSRRLFYFNDISDYYFSIALYLLGTSCIILAQREKNLCYKHNPFMIPDLTEMYHEVAKFIFANSQGGYEGQMDLSKGEPVIVHFFADNNNEYRDLLAKAVRIDRFNRIEMLFEDMPDSWFDIKNDYHIDFVPTLFSLADKIQSHVSPAK